MYYHLKTETVIHKPSADVWRVLTDFPSYPKWSRFIKKINRISDQKLSVTIKSGKSEMNFLSSVLEFESRKQFRWRGRLGGIPGLFTGEHYFILTETDQGTKLTHGERFSGLLAWVLLPFMRKNILKNFRQFNRSLKNRVEVAE